MRIVGLLLVVIAAVCLTGCEDTKLVTCQQENATLQGQLDQANAAIAAKDTKIEELKAKNVADQTTAMESISTMMQKQADADNKIKQKLVERAQQVKELQDKVAALEKQIAEDEKDDDADDGDTDD